MQGSQYYSRADWGSRMPSLPDSVQDIGRVPRVIIHHAWRPHVEATAGFDNELKAVRGVETYHTAAKPAGRAWSAIGYNFLVSQTGRIYEGRGFGKAGAHTLGQNSKSLGICLLIDGDKYLPTPEAIEAVRDVIREAAEQEYVVPVYDLKGHRDYQSYKTCPGNLVYPRLREWFSPAVTLLG